MTTHNTTKGGLTAIVTLEPETLSPEDAVWLIEHHLATRETRVPGLFESAYRNKDTSTLVRVYSNEAGNHLVIGTDESIERFRFFG